MAEIACERSEPAAAHEPPRIAHWIFAAHTCPIGERRSGNDDGTEQVWPNGREHQDSPSGLTIPNHTGFALRVGMQIDDLFKKNCLRARHILNGLARHWLRQEPDEVARVPSLERDANFAVGLEAANSRSMARARIDDNERTKRWIESNRSWRNNPDKGVVDRSLQRPPIDDQLYFEVKDMGRGFGKVLVKLISALAHHVQEKHAALRGINQIFEDWRKDAESWRTFVVRTLA